MGLTVKELGAILYGRNAERFGLLMLRAGFDASMDSPAGVTVVGGYTGSISEWEAVEKRWNAQLDIDEISSFRMTEMMRRFGLEIGLDRVEPYVKIVGESSLRGVYAVMLDTDWTKAAKDPEYLRVCPQRQHACLDLLLTILEEDMSTGVAERPLMLVAFDNDYGNSEIAARVYEAWRERTGHPGFAGITYAKGEAEWDSVPLQCADLLAWLTRRNPMWRQQLERGTVAAPPPKMDKLFRLALKASSQGRGAMWSDALAKSVAERLSQMKGASGE